MRTITITRYDVPTEVGYAGCLEGEADDGSTWVLYLDAAGRPASYWPERDASGAVLGEPIPLLTEEQRAEVRPPLE